MAFAGGAATMAVESLVPRLVAAHVGTSVAVWTATVSIVVNPQSTGTPSNTATVSSDLFDPGSSDNSATASTTWSGGRAFNRSSRR